MHKATRDPGLQLEEEKDMVCRLLVQILAEAEEPGEYAMLRSMRQLYEVIQDSDSPKQLLATLSKTLAAVASY